MPKNDNLVKFLPEKRNAPAPLVGPNVPFRIGKFHKMKASYQRAVKGMFHVEHI
jgi:hypothetical protein